MMIALFALGLQAEQLVFRTTEAALATPWEDLISGSCGGHRLEIRRSMRPLPEPPVVLLNGAQVVGAETLERELGEVGAAYRFSIECAPSDTMLLRWESGRVGDDGRVAYRSGSADFRGGLLTGARSEDSSEETLW